MSLNRWCGTGNLTRDPELSTTASGTTILRFSVAVNDRRRNSQTGQWDSYPNYIDCTMFGTRAQGLFEHLHKGLKVGIEGRLHWSQWETKEGQKRSKLEVIVDNVDFLAARAAADGQPAAAPQQQAQAPVQATPAPAPEAHVDVPDSVYADTAAAEAAVYDGIPF